MEKTSLYHLLRDVASVYADRPMYWIREESGDFRGISYKDWYENLKNLSSFLIELGMQRGNTAGLICDNRYEWSLCSLSLVTIGCVDVPRGCDATIDDLKYILEHSEAKILFLENEKVLKKLLEDKSSLANVKTLLLIDPPAKWKDLESARAQLSGVKFIFLEDALLEGEKLRSKKGDKPYDQRGEVLNGKDLATIIYTSGTTGAPKGVMLNHRSFTWGIHQLQEFVPGSYNDRTIVFLPPWHIAERLLETTLIAWGASMACSSVPTIPADMQKVKPTVLVSVPRLWEGLYKRIHDTVRKAPPIRQQLFHFAVRMAAITTSLQDTIRDSYATTEAENPNQKVMDRFVASVLLFSLYPLKLLSYKILQRVRDLFGGRMRFALCGAGAMPPHIQFFFRSAGIPIIETYGMTETTGIGAIGEFPLPKNGAIGAPLPGTAIKLVGEDGKIVTIPGEKGVAWHKGPHVTVGYYKEAEKTAKALQDGWLDSGDILTWTHTGELKFAGRAKDTIVLSGGENLEPAPIEAKLTESEFINQVIVVGQDRKNLGVLIVPFYDLVQEQFKSQGKNIPKDPAEWNSSKEVSAFFKNIVKDKISTRAGFKSFEKIAHVHILPKEFEKGKEMTETMKLKRNVVFSLYHNVIQAMYENDED
ncbi:long-chain fatty acid--CoA ligase [Leptospira yasudae]|uniref:Long-chain fatty acid--CoA ligase n=1 Tax=Leptospira yasudae TaxID=2202201 RepID=A0A6N4R3J9_9LEPT|nr:long-chain fatty acid--CoA ligase [Leptospira yasudae]TGL82231.1 long-chain fatty acid--CoA ligase [Leptospira yasudae]TGL84418.1 long-chain fatty acid--CoA ligase [Leptospira yasudae]TGL89098.1 long-chain fatty acid--CoA ligase [Leptospira yasudae]